MTPKAGEGIESKGKRTHGNGQQCGDCWEDWGFLWPYLIIYVSILITSVLNSASNRLAISLLLSSFSGLLICSFIWDIFLCLGAPIMS